jgi:hypothetical protein
VRSSVGEWIVIGALLIWSKEKRSYSSPAANMSRGFGATMEGVGAGLGIAVRRNKRRSAGSLLPGLTRSQNPLNTVGEREDISMDSSEFHIAAFGLPADTAGQDFRLSDSSKTMAKTTTKTV